jgi:sulfite reductase alpha subunit-like flavoprotein
MFQGVHAALATVLSTHGGMSAEQAEATLAGWGSSGRYLKDVWS